MKKALLVVGLVMFMGVGQAEAFDWKGLPVVKQSITITKCVLVSSGALAELAITSLKETGVFVANQANKIVSETLVTVSNCLNNTAHTVTLHEELNASDATN